MPDKWDAALLAVMTAASCAFVLHVFAGVFWQ